MKYTNSIVIRHGMLSKGSMPISPCVHLLTVLIKHYALLTCSFAAMVLHSTVTIISLSFSNSTSIKMVLTLKPALIYTCRTQYKCFARLLAVLTGTCSVVMNLICRDIVNRKAVPSTKNRSATFVNTLLVSTREHGTCGLPPQALGFVKLFFL